MNIGRIHVDSRLVLAPMAGVTDLAFRQICRELGAGLTVTEMVSAKGHVYRSPGTGELLQSLPEDQPLVVQLFGAEASFLQRAVEMLRDVGYGWFDLNMGCSVAKVLKQGAGAAMLGDVPNALEVARAMLQAAGPGRVGFKIRLGLDSQRHVWRDLSLRLQDLGAGWITLHPRTARQGFGGEAAHEVLAELKREFRPEFLNRLDEIVFYKPLTRNEIDKIVDLQVADLNRRLSDKQLTMRLTPAARSYIVAQGYDPIYGARPLKRFMQRSVETLIARKLIAEDVQPRTDLLVDYDGDKLVIDAEPECTVS